MTARNRLWPVLIQPKRMAGDHVGQIRADRVRIDHLDDRFNDGQGLSRFDKHQGIGFENRLAGCG